MKDLKEDLIVDARGLACPMPVINTKRAIQKMDPGQVLKVLATDYASESDIPVLVKRLGHELVDVSRTEGTISFFIRKAS